MVNHIRQFYISSNKKIPKHSVDMFGEVFHPIPRLKSLTFEFIDGIRRRFL